MIETSNNKGRAKGSAFVFLIAFLMIAPQPAFTEIYKWVDKDGNIKFSDKKPSENTKSETVKLKINSVKNPQVYNHSLGNNDKIVMYSATWCGVCKKARQYFKSKGIPFQEHDVEKSSKGRSDFKRLKGRGVPIILIGKQRMDGFNRDFFENKYPG